MNDETQQWTNRQFWAAVAISTASLLIIAGRIIWPKVIVLDEPMLGLLALSALPWLTLFLKKFKIPGFGEAETQDRTQGSTKNPLAPPAELQPTAIPTQVSPEAKKVLATLWRYQHQTFDDDVTKRWTFLVQENAREYPRFLAGLSEAVNRGWVAVSHDTHQCMLTNEGLAYVRAEPEIQNYQDIYRF